MDDLTRARRYREDVGRRVSRTQAEIRRATDSAARDYANAKRRYAASTADYGLELALKKIHELEDRELRDRRVLEDLDAEIAQLSQR